MEHTRPLLSKRVISSALWFGPIATQCFRTQPPAPPDGPGLEFQLHSSQPYTWEVCIQPYTWEVGIVMPAVNPQFS